MQLWSHCLVWTHSTRVQRTQLLVEAELFYLHSRQQCLALIGQVVRAFGMNAKGGFFIPLFPLRLRHFLSLELWHFRRNICLCIEYKRCFLCTVNILNVYFTSKYLYHQSQYSNTWDSKCVALISQVVKSFSMNLKVGVSSPPQVETFSVSKTWTLSREYTCTSQK